MCVCVLGGKDEIRFSVHFLSWSFIFGQFLFFSAFSAFPYIFYNFGRANYLFSPRSILHFFTSSSTLSLRDEIVGP